MIDRLEEVVKNPLNEQATTPTEDSRLAAFRDYLEAIDRRSNILPAQRHLRGLGFSVCVVTPRAMNPSAANPIVHHRAVESDRSYTGGRS